ncbi:1-acylglycerol-3-phosphate O-acyltransferase [Vibrio sp. SS-MA-C1-2]|uniref:1-acylglycerol-3-phosphate O-acyltransferase n=1 Tax=Vibrio sp. SS-MA-C1-2 TaxID=2908646 RepID=UPI001F1FB7F1|nr:1-acylglycerol-3-phosphate O-acyltransferase [Vibrio sp. SS-MA-C1-2]UJF19100.1 1-acylglycerol-3-phosphate O-acyltransferase [Vibrio sp. SS-MA-C1-2]
MILILRLIAVAIFAIVTSIFGTLYCMLSPRNPKHVFTFGRWFSKMSRVFGIKLEFRLPEDAYKRSPSIYVGNHQNNWDLFTISGAVVPKVVTVGKKSLVWLPFFGVIYWITGNILIDRANRSKAVGTMDQVVKQIKEKSISVWMFPEGTRSRGRGLLPFKTGAFHAAIAAKIPLVPIVCSSTDHINLNRWDNGHVIVEMMPEIDSTQYEKTEARAFATECREQMAAKLDELNEEVKIRNKR